MKQKGCILVSSTGQGESIYGAVGAKIININH